jgi:hypothetical protein
MGLGHEMNIFYCQSSYCKSIVSVYVQIGFLNLFAACFKEKNKHNVFACFFENTNPAGLNNVQDNRWL